MVRPASVGVIRHPDTHLVVVWSAAAPDNTDVAPTRAILLWHLHLTTMSWHQYLTILLRLQHLATRVPHNT
ncbi:hypothetical protein Pmani_019255 [Petrolisthes manimaculis]|uniref:Uncharacterized protein n=1 Tax=Petrolisthes manimaculis TaxID=1843537 RepID=A0AAE1PIJ5_9EUCA|nr:hypothetical protein Pmani_019255 [Petrolisthes manimaculis]